MNKKEKSKKLYADTDILLVSNKTLDSPEYRSWKSDCLNFLNEEFGETSEITSEFKNIILSISLSSYNMDKFRQGLQKAKRFLRNIEKNAKDKIFIVHGHDELFKMKVEKLVEKQGIEAVILNDEAIEGKTIIEKLEKYGNSVDAAIILMTADDTGVSNKEKNEAEKNKESIPYRFRARQNVILEIGYFIAYLGRNRVVLLIPDEGIEIPSDINGMGYSPKSNWEMSLLRELKAMGFYIDSNVLL